MMEGEMKMRNFGNLGFFALSYEAEAGSWAGADSVLGGSIPASKMDRI